VLTLWVGCGSDSGNQGGSGDGDSSGDGGGDAVEVPDGGIVATKLTGMLGDLGTVVDTVSSKVISNSGETLVYLTSAELTCDQLMVSRWLGAFDKGAQVVEIVISGPPHVGQAYDDAEVNYASGGKSSAYEVGAKTTHVVFTESQKDGPVAGTVSATYANGGHVQGVFRAEFCGGGQGY